MREKPTVPGSSGFSLFRRLRRKNAWQTCLILIGFFAFLHMAVAHRYIKWLEGAIVSLQVESHGIFSSICGKFSNFHHFMSGDVDKVLMDLRCENIKLRQNIENLRHLEQENENLRKLLLLKQTESNMVTVARVVTVLSNSFSRSCVFDVGSLNNIALDSIVRDENGLVGRIIEVSDSWSRVLLITDANSNIPVKIVEANAIAGGDNSDKLQIAMVREDVQISDGDMVETSGYGEVFMEKIPVGRVKKNGDDLCIVPFVNFNRLKYVSVIQKVGKLPESSS
jgi:rod shape-determining protein MreC